MTDRNTSLQKTIAGFLARRGMGRGRFGREATGNPSLVARLAAGLVPRLATADRVLAYMGEEPFGPAFRREVEAFIAVTRTKAHLLGQDAMGDPSFVARLRQGASPRLDTCDRVSAWMESRASEAERRAVLAVVEDGVPAGPVESDKQREAEMNEDELYMGTRELAAFLGLSPRTLDRLPGQRRGSEALSQVRQPGPLRPRTDVEAWAAERRYSSTSDEGGSARRDGVMDGLDAPRLTGTPGAGFAGSPDKAGDHETPARDTAPMNAHRLVARQNSGLRMRSVGFGCFALSVRHACGLRPGRGRTREDGDRGCRAAGLGPAVAASRPAPVHGAPDRAAALCRIDTDRARSSRRSAGALSPRGRGNAAAGRDRRGGGTCWTHRGGDRPRGAVYRSSAPGRRYDGRRSAREYPWRGRKRRVVAGRRHLDRSARRSAGCLDRALRLRVALRCGPANGIEIVRRRSAVFHIHALAGTQRYTVSASTQDSAAGDGGGNLTSQTISTETDYDPWPEIEGQLKELLDPGTRLSVAPSSASVTVSGTPRDIARARAYLGYLNREVLRPVTLSVHVYSVRVEREADYDLGLSFSIARLLGEALRVSVGSNAVALIKPSPGGESGDTLSATVKALNSAGVVSRVLSADIPSLNGKPAQFFELFQESLSARAAHHGGRGHRPDRARARHGLLGFRGELPAPHHRSRRSAGAAVREPAGPPVFHRFYLEQPDDPASGLCQPRHSGDAEDRARRDADGDRVFRPQCRRRAFRHVRSPICRCRKAGARRPRRVSNRCF